MPLRIDIDHFRHDNSVASKQPSQYSLVCFGVCAYEWLHHVEGLLSEWKDKFNAMACDKRVNSQRVH